MVVVGMLTDEIDPARGTKDEYLARSIGRGESLQRCLIAVRLGSRFFAVDRLQIGIHASIALKYRYPRGKESPSVRARHT